MVFFQGSAKTAPSWAPASPALLNGWFLPQSYGKNDGNHRYILMGIPIAYMDDNISLIPYTKLWV